MLATARGDAPDAKLVVPAMRAQTQDKKSHGEASNTKLDLSAGANQLEGENAQSRKSDQHTQAEPPNRFNTDYDTLTDEELRSRLQKSNVDTTGLDRTQLLQAVHKKNLEVLANKDSTFESWPLRYLEMELRMRKYRQSFDENSRSAMISLLREHEEWRQEYMQFTLN